MEKNLTTGGVFKNVIYFSLPYLLSYFLQTLYGMADLFIIGRFGTVADITAVSVGSQVMHMLTVIIVGLAMGTTVTISLCIGADDKKRASLAVGNTATMFLGLSFVLTLVLVAFVSPIVGLMSTPAEAAGGTELYLTVCFAGIPFITAYNIISSVFRGMGDSKSPMYFIAVSCITNIVLDIVFMGVMELGPAGAALGTTISQAISVALAFWVIIKKKFGLKMKKSDFIPQKGIMSQMLKIGIPVALQDGFIQISFIIITIISNQRGLSDAAAVGIVEKIIGVLFLVPSSMLSAVSALAAQNLGAQKPERARLTLRYAIFITAGFGFVVAFVLQFASGFAVSLFKNDPQVVLLGGQYLKSYCLDCMIAGIHFCFSGYFCATERSGISFLHNLLSIVLVRVPGAYLGSKMFADTLYPMGLAAPAGSLLSVIICVVAYRIIRRKEEN